MQLSIPYLRKADLGKYSDTHKNNCVSTHICILQLQSTFCRFVVLPQLFFLSIFKQIPDIQFLPINHGVYITIRERLSKRKHNAIVTSKKIIIHSLLPSKTQFDYLTNDFVQVHTLHLAHRPLKSPYNSPPSWSGCLCPPNSYVEGLTPM